MHPDQQGPCKLACNGESNTVRAAQGKDSCKGLHEAWIPNPGKPLDAQPSL